MIAAIYAAAGAEKLTVNMHVVHNFTVVMRVSGGSCKCNVEC